MMVGRLQRRLLIIPILTALIVSAAAKGHAETLSDLTFLIGEWSGAGGGDPGQGLGSFSFASDLQGRVLVRRAHTEYPASASAPAFAHDDLLIVYANLRKAVYFDNEGHVIHYDITTDGNAKTVTFLSVDAPPSPLFRLTYNQTGPDTLRITFELAPTGKREDLRPYVAGEVTRKKNSG
ncbi:MAG TPA: hypothetical protein VF456_10865 [Vicinamibacterales bacterium]